MSPHDFSMWLNGFVEMNPNAMPTQTQWQIIKDHLALVFKKETPNYGLFPNTPPGVRGPAIMPQPAPIMPYVQPYKPNLPAWPDGQMPVVTC